MRETSSSSRNSTSHVCLGSTAENVHHSCSVRESNLDDTIHDCVRGDKSGGGSASEIQCGTSQYVGSQQHLSRDRLINFQRLLLPTLKMGFQIKGCYWNETGAKKPHPSSRTKRPLGHCSQLAALQPAPCLQVRALRSQVCQQRLVLSRRTSKENG